MKENKVWDKMDAKAVDAFGEDYRRFLSAHKTERENVAGMTEILRAEGALSLSEAAESGRELKPGDLVYADMMKKTLLVFRIGRRPVTDGCRLLGAHIDSPRLDLKQNPLYEDTDLAMLDTHYYGGIKKYQWVTIPLALHGVVAKKDGSVVEINIGDRPEDPVFGVSDLLIHLAGKQMGKTAGEAIEGENLNLLIGSQPLPDTEKDAVKANVLRILKEMYDIEEEDFLSAEIEVVPAGEARDYGLDRSMIMGYGHDDRVCAYPSFRAILDVKEPEYTAICLLTDKEEIGSVGATGTHSRFFENTVAEVMNLLDQDGIVWQTAELGKVDEGGGGTIAYILANLGMEVIDCGVAVLNMHAPWEIICKADVYEAYKAYCAFIR